MKNDDQAESTIEASPWPDKLEAHVVTPGQEPRIHGYRLFQDIARNYNFGEFILLALTGTPPSTAWGRAVNIALVALANTDVRSASVHTATLARRCGADAAGVLATGMIALTEEIAHSVQTSDESDPDEKESVRSFVASLPEEARLALDSSDASGSVHSAAMAVLKAAGLTNPLQQMAALSVARLPILAAEAAAIQRGDVRTYPMRLPQFDYAPHEDE